VVFTNDTGDALLAAVGLVNSAGDPDTLTTIDDANAFYDAHGYTGARPRTRADLEAVRALREPLRQLLTAERDEAVPLVNAILAEHRALPQLLRHDALDWHLHAVELTAPFATRVAVETALAMVDVIRSNEMSRLGICAADDCDDVALDLSRNRSRRFCSTACGNREAVAAYPRQRS